MNQNSTSLKISSLVALLLTLGSCANDPATIQREMVGLDRVYIPTLFYTSRKDTEKSRQTITQLQIAWERFNANHYRDKPDTLWRNTFDEVGGLISRADGLLNTGDNTESAHEALEKIRVMLGKLRKSYGMEIFSDYLTDFHEPMEAIVTSVKGASSESLTDSTIDVLKALTFEAQTLWAVIGDSLELDSSLYEVSLKEQIMLRKLIDQETQNLISLHKALDTPDNQANHEYKQTIIDRALAIKPPFIKTYTFFGALSD